MVSPNSIQSFQKTFYTMVGQIDTLVDEPENYDQLAIVCHPNPCFGGTNQNKVTATMARTLNQEGFCTIRPNFRGVGSSTGSFDEGIGETEDMIQLIDQAIQAYPTDKPITLAGFSFGAYVLSRVLDHLRPQAFPIDKIILAGLPVGLFECVTLEESCLIIHGANDEVIPVNRVLEWLKPQDHPVVVVPGVDHFFSGKLHVVKQIVSEFVQR